ncbi:MAG: hypothetical protein DHS20C11_06340 [Lysobacteraceae bacterium]|nr:MAG: hypothetical protein DHS20C11_06340 [Xanthomonadaceae bacterium]
MDKTHFDSLFEMHVAAPLVSVGFSRFGLSLAIQENDRSVALIRLGGRMAAAGCISHILCFRHTYLPTLNSGDVLEGFEPEVFSYPIKARPSGRGSWAVSSFKYRPQNARYDWEKFCYSSLGEVAVAKYLRKVLRRTNSLVAWSREPGLVVKLVSQISRFGDGAWMEQQWLKAYETANLT